MALIIWNNNYAIGLAEIDQQHQKLVQIINNLFDAISKKEREQILESSLKELINYTMVHFKFEEELLKRYNYLDFLQHVREHSVFIDKINSYVKDFKKGDNKIMIDVINYLKDWLLNHILLVDKKYVATLLNGGYK
jgi:hemerythrin-like metal-binding protein